MNTINSLAAQWWNGLAFDSINTDVSKTHYCKKYKYHTHCELTPLGIEDIFYQEVIIKWAAANSSILSFGTESDIKEAYLDEQTEPTFVLGEVYTVEGKPQSVLKTIDVEEKSETPLMRKIKDYVLSLDTPENEIYQNNSLLIQSCFAKALEFIEEDLKPKAEEVDVWDEIYSMHPITWETPAVQQIIQYIQKYYTLTKK